MAARVSTSYKVWLLHELLAIVGLLFFQTTQSLIVFDVDCYIQYPFCPVWIVFV